VGIKKVNITISEVDAQLELVVRLGEFPTITSHTEKLENKY
jgi:hypothetical protein